jgi:hypothetical protein
MASRGPFGDLYTPLYALLVTTLHQWGFFSHAQTR